MRASIYIVVSLLISDCRNSSDYVDGVTYYNTNLTSTTTLTASSLQQHQQAAQCRGPGGIAGGTAAGMFVQLYSVLTDGKNEWNRR
jgi:hypothetical protein